MAAEVKLKIGVLSEIVPQEFELSEGLVQEFIKVTGRSLKGQDIYNKVLSSLKMRP